MAGLETLDEYAPRDTDPVSLGDDAIRETRAKTKTSVGTEHYLDGPHKIPGGAQSVRPAAGRVGRLYFNTDIKSAEYDTGSVWSSASDAKARASILWHGANISVPSGSTRYELPFDYVIDDPGGFANTQTHQIVQPDNSMGMVSAYIELGAAPGGFGMFLIIEQWSGGTWYPLVQSWTPNQPQIAANTMVDSRWGLPLRVTVTNGSTGAVTINATGLGASPRFGYNMFGRTA